ncbi:MAG: hypothetical protein MUC89_05040 [Acetobacteraceae bacterium]|nr:hypothetical protein [Acetobacteraceae bacterium]
MTATDAIGLLAGLLVLCTFWMQRMVALRLTAIASNVVFFAYGVLAELYPIFLLHALLLPLNLQRLHQLRTAAVSAPEASACRRAPEHAIECSAIVLSGPVSATTPGMVARVAASLSLHKYRGFNDVDDRQRPKGRVRQLEPDQR